MSSILPRRIARSVTVTMHTPGYHEPREPIVTANSPGHKHPTGHTCRPPSPTPHRPTVRPAHFNVTPSPGDPARISPPPNLSARAADHGIRPPISSPLQVCPGQESTKALSRGIGTTKRKVAEATATTERSPSADDADHPPSGEDRAQVNIDPPKPCGGRQTTTHAGTPCPQPDPTVRNDGTAAGRMARQRLLSSCSTSLCGYRASGSALQCVTTS